MLSIVNETETKVFQQNQLTVKIYPTVQQMGKAAAQEVADRICNLLEGKAEINMIFAAAPSQEEFLHHLISDQRINWNRINAFHMDEYIGLLPDAPQSFGNFLRIRIFDKVPFKNVYYLNGHATDLEEECTRYTSLLSQFPTDIVCLGIGENGHIAFNDPDVANFNDPKLIKIVKLDHVCRQQQVNEKCFETLEQVPTEALTLTIPALLKAKWTCYDAGVHSACIVRWPGVVKPGSVSDALVEYVDIVPTFVDIIGGKPQAKVDGESFKPVLTGKKKAHKKYSFSLQTTRGINAGSPYYGIRSVYDGRYRYIVNLTPEATFQNVETKSPLFKEWKSLAETDSHAKAMTTKYQHRPAIELYDVKNDPYCMKNLAEDAKQASTISRLDKELKRWMKDCGDEGQPTEMRAFEHMPGKRK